MKRSKLAVYFFLIVYSIVILCPLLWLVNNSFKSDKEIFDHPLGLFKHLQISNYLKAWSYGNLGYCLRNSIIVCSLGLGITILIAPMAGYALARFNFLGQRLVFYLLLGGIFIAPATTLIPLVVFLQQLRMIDTYFALIFPYVAYGLPISIFLLRASFISMPRSLEDSAKIDGLSHFQIYWKILLPLALPVLYTVIILRFILMWNEFLFALIFTRSINTITLPRGIMSFQGTHSTMLGCLSAGVVIAAALPVILYILFSERIRKGISMGVEIRGG